MSEGGKLGVARRRRHIRPVRLIATVAAIVGSCAYGVPTAQAIVGSPVTVDGPSSDILDFGGVAIAPDGTGGLVYVKSVAGVPHVFACRYSEGHWSPPIRVDADQPFDASSPRIAAGEHGRLLVVWVTQVATVHSQIQRGLFSASLGPGAASFGPALLVDPNVGDGTGIAPSLAGTEPGRAIVAYRVVTEDFANPLGTTAVQLRSGDVMADIRLARLSADRWSRIGAINRNPAASMRPPGPANGPEVGIGADGNAVVAWQEPDQGGTARIWMRRVFGTVLGSVLEASPTSWGGKPVTDDSDAFSLDVTDLGQARVAMRVGGGPGTALGGPRIFLNTLPPGFSLTAGALAGAVIADGSGAVPLPGALGTPSIAANDHGADQGSARLAFSSGGAIRQAGVDDSGKVIALAGPSGPGAAAGAPALAAVSPEGGGIAAWPSSDAQGRPVVAVRQDFASGFAQTGLISGAQSGPVSELSVGRADSGDALFAFRQGEAGHFEVVAERVSTPPAEFSIHRPSGWVRPPRAKLRWDVAPSATGGLTYALVLDGRVAKSGLVRRRFTPAPGLLGDGIRRVQILATDALGEQTLSRSAKLRIDARPPSAILAPAERRGSGRSGAARRGVRSRLVVVRLRDPESGVRAASCSFGDGTPPVRGRAVCRHIYARAGRYAIVVRAGDKVGNHTVRRLAVRVR